MNTRFVVTERPEEPKELYDRYVERGETENRIKDYKNALRADRLSCRRFWTNQFRRAAARGGLLALGHPAHG